MSNHYSLIETTGMDKELDPKLRFVPSTVTTMEKKFCTVCGKH